ncbi:MAG: PKD domain-containing protein, partial [Zoogloea sp.]|uniref:PKD domain-containing protein n=1 Tax=Zoogloea sp. TaxID=49181 RepID=UPI002607C0D4
MAAIYGEERVNYYTNDHQYGAQIALLADGSYVVSWVSRGQDGSDDGIYAQRYNSVGMPVGAEFRVNSSTAGAQIQSAIASLSDGGFVIAWSDQYADGSSWGVFAQRYDALGVAQGSQFRINETTTHDQGTPSIAAAGGGFVVTWASQYQDDGGSYGVYARRFAGDGSPSSGEFLVNTTLSSNQNEPAIAAFASGDFVVAWRSEGQDGSGGGVYAQRFDAAGARLGGEFQVSTTTYSNQSDPHAAVLADGSFVVVWADDGGQDGSGYGVYAQRFDAAGNRLGGEFLINGTTYSSQYQPAVTALASGGFVVSWYNDYVGASGTGSAADVYVREYAADGSPVGAEVKVNSPSGSYYQYEPAVAHLGSDNFVVVWRSDGQDGSNAGIYQQLFGSAAELQRGNAAPVLADFGGTVSFGENLVNAAPQVLDPLVSFSAREGASFDGGVVTVFFVSGGSPADQLSVRGTGSGVGEIDVAGSEVRYGGVVIGELAGGTAGAALSIRLNAAASVDAIEALVQGIAYANTSFSPLASRQVGVRIEDGSGVSTAGGIVTVNITREQDGTPALDGQEPVNTYTPGEQASPAIGKLSDGGYVIAWISNGQDGSGWGIHAQRYSAAGVAVGPEVQVNTATYGEQSYPQVAGLSDGGYVIVWQDNGSADGSGWGVFGQRFGADGSPAGGQFIVNTTTPGSQLYEAVTSYTGGFAVAWSADANVPGGNGHDIYLTRFDNAGNVVGTPEMRVSVNPGTSDAQSGYQYYPRLAARADGDLVIVWRDDSSNDGSSHGVYGRTFDAASGSFGDVFLVNQVTSGAQYEPDVAMFADGSFVVVWRDDNGLDGSGSATFGRRFDAAGVAVGDAFLVNENAAGSQYQPKVTALLTGGFVVAFYNDTGEYWGDTYLREFNAAGQPVDSDRRVNSDSGATYRSQYEPAITDLGNGNFVVAWRADNNADGSASGIYQQVFGDSAELARQGNPDLSDFTGAVSFMENAANGGLQILDAAVSLSDADSADFSGGRLDLYYLSGGAAEDQLGVVAGGLIGVAGNVVSYAGTVIGTLSGGVNGANLRIDLSGSAATAEAVQALVQHLGYANTDSSPNASRTLGLRITDGDGGASAPNVLTINVVGQLDGTPALDGQEPVNTYTPGEQASPAIGKLSDGGYVIAWISNGQDGSGWGIHAQRYSAAGVAVGPEVQVNTATYGEQSYPQVAGLSDGGYVIVWQDNGSADGSGWGVFGQRFGADGSPAGGQFIVNTTTPGSQLYEAVTSYTGGFAVAWSADANVPGGNGHDIYLTRFDNAGNVVGTPEMRVSVNPGTSDAQSGYQYYPRLAARADGDLVIVWRDDSSNDGSSHGVYGRTFDAASGSFGDVFLVNQVTSGAQYEPDVAMFADGSFVVVWRDDNGLDGSGSATFGRRFDAAGVAVGDAFLVNENAAGSQYQPKVTALLTGGFVVAFYNDTGEYWGDTYLREFNAAGQPVDSDRRVNSDSGATYRSQYEPAITDLGNGNFVVAWRADNNADGSASGIYQQVFGDSAELARQGNPDLSDFTGAVSFMENAANGGLQILDAAVSLSDADSADFSGGRLDLYYLSGGTAEDQLGVVAGGPIGVAGNVVSYAGVAIGTLSGGVNGANLRIDLNGPAATAEAVQALVQHLGYANTDSSPNASRTLGLRITDGDGGASAPNVLTITVTPEADGTPPAYPQEQVNTHVQGEQTGPAIGRLADGGYVIAWNAADQDGSSWGVYAQRFSAAGVAVGPEMRVNAVTGGEQSYPQVAGLATGGYVITWQDPNGNDLSSGWGVFAQRFGADGNPVGGQFVVSTTTLGYQLHSVVASHDQGFVVAWSADSNVPGSNGYDIYLTRFDNAGNVLGTPEERVSLSPGSADAQPGNQDLPRIAAHADGSMMLVWRDSNGNDGSGWGIFGRTFDAVSGSFGSTVQLNTYTYSTQIDPDVAALADGGYVVVWRDDNGRDGSGYATYAQRFDASGTAVGSEFRVNDNISGNQYMAKVSGLATGGFVVAFYNDSGEYWGDTYIREFDAVGNPVDGDRRVNDDSPAVARSQYEPAIADLGNGNFVVAWRADGNADGSASGVFQRVFGDAAGLPRGPQPVLDDLAPAVSFGVADMAAPQRIDSDLQVSAEASLAGGSLWVYFTSGAGADDALSVLSGGSGAGQIGVSGSEVSHAGVVIGSIAGGSGGAPLVISLNANATAVAVRALAENIGYQYTDASVPAGTIRSVAYRLFDGAGMASNSREITITLAASAPVPSLTLDEFTPVVSLTESQSRIEAVLDGAVSLVQGPGSLDGAVLSVSFVANGRPSDELGIVADGSGAGQVDVSGSNDVSYEGIVIGRMIGGAQGNPMFVELNAAASAEAVEAVIERVSYQSTTAGPLASRSLEVRLTDAGGAATARTVTINISPEADGAVPRAGQERVNTYLPGDQSYPAMATLADGSYVVVWQSNGQDGSGWGIHGQHFTAAGVPIGTEFQVNSYTTNSQDGAAVAALAGGGFVVAWRSENQDSSSGGVYAQVFGAAGERVGDALQVNTVSTYDQTHAAVLGLADGGFVVAFADQVQDGSSYGSFAQRYDAGGNALGGYFQLNTYTYDSQYLPVMAALRDDAATAGVDEAGFVAVWRSHSQDGSGAGIYGQRFNAVGERLGGEFQINTNTVGNQYNPTVATLAGGEFVVVWSDESDASVRGQRYTAGGVAVGGEFVVNTPDFPSNYEQYPQVTALANGGFVVAWDAYYNATVGDYYNVWAQQFDAAGNKVDGPLLLSDNATNTQLYPAITGLSGGGFVAAWANSGLDQPGVGDYGVYQRLFGAAGTPARPVSPQLLDLESEVSFAENAVNAAPQLLDPGLRVVEGASPSFDGGVLSVAVLQGYGSGAGYDAEGPGQDVFTILHEGNGAGQVGVAGAVVSFGGVQVGTLQGGQNGLALQVRFNAAATAEIVEQVAERLAYRNVSSAPAPSRLVEVVVSDGHGGQSAARTITVNVAAETDGSVPLLVGDTHVNTYTTDSQIFPTVIHLAGPSGGQYMVIWQSNGQDSDSYGVFAQRYDANGAAIGAEFQVSTTTPGNQGADSGVRAAALADGGFVVAWEAPDGWSRGIFAQRFDATGVPAGGEWRVNPSVNYDQLQPTLTGLADGGFVIAYAEENGDGNSYGSFFVRYDAAGVAQGAPVLINDNPAGGGTAFTTDNQSFPQLSALAGGGFVATWHSYGQDGSAWGIYARLFDNSGAPTTDSFQVHTTALGSQERPDVATLANGDFVIVWTSDNDPGSDTEAVFMQRFTATGVPVGGETLVNNGTSASHYDAYARVTALDTGGFVVGWEADDGWGRGFYIQQYDAAGSKVDGPQRVSSNASSDQSYGDVEGLPGGRFVVAWSATNEDAAGSWGIYQNVFGAAGAVLPSQAPVLSNVVASVGFQENSLGTPQLLDTAVGLFDGDSPDFAGGRLTVSVISGYSSLNQDIGDYRGDQDNFSILDESAGASPVNVLGNQVRIGSTVIGTLLSDGQAGRDLVIEFNASATQPLVERVIERLAYRNPSSDPVAVRQVSISLSDGDGATSTPQVVQINIATEPDGAQPLGQPELVNTYQTAEQLLPATATLADGGYVIVWQSMGEDGWDNAIVGQRYAANGTPLGNEFKVNAYTPGAQTSPAVTGLADGGWVVTYTDQWRDGSGYSVWAQRFDAAGSPAGAEFRVNSSTSGSQYDSAVSAHGTGFVVAWFSDGERNGEYYDIFFQRYDASGAPVGEEIRANPGLAGNPWAYQLEPAIVGLTNGNLVVTWRSEGQDGSNSGVYAQVFDGLSGNALGDAFQLNQYVTDYQYAPRIAAVGTGFVATWISRGQDGSGDGIYARRYDAAGNALGDEFRVNEASYSEQRSPDIAATGDGGFVITWRDHGGDDIYAQKFDASGARVDGQIQISSPATSSDDAPVVAGLAGNAFVVAWHGYYDGNSSGIFQRVVGEPQAFAHGAAPQIVDLATRVSFQENALNAAPQLIDAGIGLLDGDSANFAGGRLDVSFLTTYGDPNQYGVPGLQAQDQLGIRHQGMAAEQIGVVGSTVYFGGTAIGTITGNGANGSSLVVSFNAAATPNAVEHLIENLTYQNFLSNPEPSRTVSLRLADGSGGVTAPLSITLDIVANPDGAVMYGAEQVVSRVADGANQAGNQVEPAIATLAGGGYVVAYTETSGLDGSGYSVFARRYDVNDNPLGDPFQVNIRSQNTQDEPEVLGLPGGGFVVVWTSNDFQVDTSGDGVFMRRYLADGSPAPEGEVLVNTSISGNQYQPAVSQSQDGGFIVAWYSDGELGGAYYDVFFQRFDATGNKLGVETRASTPVPANPYIAEYEPAIALLNDGSGDFVLTWTDNTADGSGSGIFGQRFNADGSADGAQFRVNSYIDSTQAQPAMAALGAGAFVVVWTSYGQDGSSQGIYGQRYDAAGNPAGAEFRVNYTIAGDQLRPAVTGLTNGGFVVTWDDGSNVWLQQYDAGGRAVDSQVPINNVSTEYGADVAATADGGFLVAYTGYRDTANGGNNSYEVLLQRYSNTSPEVSDVAVSGLEDSDIVLLDSVFAAGFSDADGQTLAAVRIVTLPASGTLTLDGAAVLPGQEISVADLAAGRLVYRGSTDFAGLDAFRWTGSDGNVFSTQSVFTNITVNNVNDGPRLEAGPNRVTDEGQYFAQTLTIGDPDVGNAYRVTVDWGYSQNGSPVTSSFSTASHAPVIDHRFPDNGSYTVTITVDDQQGQPNSVETDSFTVVVSNVQPTLALAGDNTVEQGQPYTLSLGNVVDPGADTVTRYSIDWGDGTPPQVINAADLPANRQLTHSFASAAAVTIVTTVTDEDGSFVAGSKNITVAAPAEVITVDAGSDASIGEGRLFSRSISFTDPADQDPAGRSASINWGDGTPVEVITLGAGQFSFNISHVFADDRATPFAVEVSVSDDGFQTATDSFNVGVINVAPTLALIGDGAVSEGSPYTLTLGSVQDVAADTVSEYRIDWGDGSPLEVIPSAAMPASRQFAHTYADGATAGTARQIAVTLVDEDGTHLNAGVHPLSVLNVAPSVSIIGAASVAEGALYTLTLGSRVDPGADSATLYRIDWGDGSTQNQYTATEYAALVASGGSVTHRFADGASNPTITVHVFDEDGEHVAASRSVSVTDVAPTATLSGAASVDEGSVYSLSITDLVDPGADTVSSYRIVWGDEASPGDHQLVTAQALAASGGIVQHTYADGGASHVVQVSAANEEGNFALGSVAVTVNDVAPAIALGGAASIAEGGSYTLTLGPRLDPGADTPSRYSIEWGDGSARSELSPAAYDALVASGGQLTHVYADGASNPIITVRVTDEDGEHVAAVKNITVTNVAPTATVSGAATVAEGSLYTLSVSAITDPGADTRSSYTIAWGDGTTDSFTAAEWTAAAGSFTHTYADGPGSATITVSTTDEDGSFTLGTQAVTIDNVAPTATVSGAATVAEGSLYTLTVSAITDPGADTRSSYTIAWGDGTTDNFTAAEWTAAAGSFSHTYADGPGSTTITVSTTDEDGTTVLGTQAVTIDNIAPTASVSGAATVAEGSLYTLSVGPIADPGADTRSSYTIAWGDGTTDSFTAAEWTAAAGSFTHTYADGQGSATITVSTTDDDGSFTLGSQAVTIDNVAPTLDATGAATATVGVAYTLALANYLDPGQDSLLPDGI